MELPRILVATALAALLLTGCATGVGLDDDDSSTFSDDDDDAVEPDDDDATDPPDDDDATDPPDDDDAKQDDDDTAPDDDDTAPDDDDTAPDDDDTAPDDDDTPPDDDDTASDDDDSGPDDDDATTAACDDGLHNGIETDVDCGGDCTPCLTQRGCLVPSDCAEGRCEAGLCRVPLCVRDPAYSLPSHSRVVGSTTLDVICQPEEDVFTLMVLPDTQMYVADSGDITMFDKQTEYIRVMADHPDNNAIFTAHLGDVVNNAEYPQEWPRAAASMDGLSTYEYDGIVHVTPYGIAWGDHDVLSYNDTGVYPTTPRPKYSDEIVSGAFSAAAYKANHTLGPTEYWPSWFRSYTHRFARNSYHFFDAGGDGYLVLLLEYCPDQATIDWAAERLSWYAATANDRKAILVMHSFLQTDGSLHDYKWGGDEKCWEFENATLASGNPSDIYSQLVVPHNVVMVLNGHANGNYASGEPWKGGTYSRMVVPAAVSGAASDRTVHSLLINYQHLDQGGLGYMRVLRFHPSEDRVHSTIWSEYSWDLNGSAWNPTYVASDPDQLDPLNFQGDPAEPFNEDLVCSAIDLAALNPGRCLTWQELDGSCGDLDSFAAAYTLSHPAAPWSTFTSKCNRFSFSFDMSGPP